jgi:hypothetical protein
MPWELCAAKQSDNANDPELYFSRQPVPGIYAKTKRKKRYLVALKGSSKRDTENIFVHSKKEANSDLDKLKELDKVLAPAETKETNFTNRISIEGSASSNSDCDKNGRYDDWSLENDRRPILTTMISVNRPRSCSSSKASIISANRPVHSPSYILNGTGGPYLHQQSPFRKKHQNRRSVSPSHLYISHERFYHEKVNHVDINEHKFLRKPLEIEYCDILGRWIFSAELRMRTVKVEMYKRVSYIKKDPRTYRKTCKRELLCLDDCVSWVLLDKTWLGRLSDSCSGKEKRRGYGQGANSGLKGLDLYIVDDETEGMRRQSAEESSTSWKALESLSRESHLPRIFAGEEGCEEEGVYMPVVRYLGLVCLEKP